MAQIAEEAIREHMVDASRKPTQAQHETADELVDVVKAYSR